MQTSKIAILILSTQRRKKNEENKTKALLGLKKHKNIHSMCKETSVYFLVLFFFKLLFCYTIMDKTKNATENVREPKKQVISQTEVCACETQTKKKMKKKKHKKNCINLWTYTFLKIRNVNI